MKRRLFLLTLFTAIVISGLIVFEACNRQAPQCPLCNRDIHSHMQVSIVHNHLPLKTCCMACALTFKAQEKNVEITAATDFDTNTAIDPEKAFYVVESDISPCLQDQHTQKVIREPHETLYACYDRCSPGILAFSTKSAAENFRKEHGGKLSTYVELEHMMMEKRGGHHHDQ